MTVTTFLANALTPVYSVLPVLFIMTVTGIKDAYENYRKERSDDEINSQESFKVDALIGLFVYSSPRG